jgi:hypothetical protein
MEDSFLHFVWKFQQFNNRTLQSETGLKVTILDLGYQNRDAGPDFKNVRIKIGEIVWNGNVKIHVHAADWQRHSHQEDDAYDNVILHVVWKNESIVRRKEQTVIPVLELKDIVDQKLILNHNKFFESANEILCNRYLDKVKPITIHNMMDKVLAERLQAKLNLIFKEIALTDNDWEEISWRILCKIFGFKTNAEVFYDLGKSTPFKLLKKESDTVQNIEAILIGQAGFFEEDIADGYFQQLKKEYLFKKKKYDLDRRIDKHQWKFLRLRPANFPTIRIAQVSSIIGGNPNLFSTLIHFNSFQELRKNPESLQSSYWRGHYNFGKQATSTVGKLGRSSIDNILVNTVPPILFAYGIHKDQEEYTDRAVEVLTCVKTEINATTKKWVAFGMVIKNAFDSQASLHLYNQYCLTKRCLNCNIGAELIRSGQ